MRAKRLMGFTSLICMIILILDGKTSISGALQGMELCIKTVIPALFPFLFLSGILNGAFLGSSIPPLKPLGNWMGIPSGAESILISSFLGGYPVGAKTAADSYHSGAITKETAEHMLLFCSNAGPSFLFGMIAPQFSSWKEPWSLWAIHVLGALTIAFIYPGNAKHTQKIPSIQIRLTDVLTGSTKNMALICAWVIMFRIMIQFLQKWFLWLIPKEGQVLVYGILELTNGCCQLGNIEDPAARFIICSSILAGGGLCVSMQTMSVLRDLSPKYYFGGKILQTILCTVAAIFFTLGIPVIPIWILLLGAYRFKKTQKSSSISRYYGV